MKDANSLIVRNALQTAISFSLYDYFHHSKTVNLIPSEYLNIFISGTMSGWMSYILTLPIYSFMEAIKSNNLKNFVLPRNRIYEWRFGPFFGIACLTYEIMADYWKYKKIELFK